MCRQCASEPGGVACGAPGWAGSRVDSAAASRQQPTRLGAAGPCGCSCRATVGCVLQRTGCSEAGGGASVVMCVRDGRVYGGAGCLLARVVGPQGVRWAVPGWSGSRRVSAGSGGGKGGFFCGRRVCGAVSGPHWCRFVKRRLLCVGKGGRRRRCGHERALVVTACRTRLAGVVSGGCIPLVAREIRRRVEAGACE